MMSHKVLILGSGAREHAIVEKIRKSDLIDTIYVCPGNDAMSGGKVSTHDYLNKLKDTEFDNYLITFCNSNNVNMVIVGSETYLVNGICDLLQSHNIKCFGPSKSAALIEGSKIFSKKFMLEHNIPTAKYITNNGAITDECMTFMQSRTNKVPEYVIKLDKLAFGKGVFIPSSVDVALKTLNIFYNKDIIIEDKIDGEEVSVMGFCNGKDIVLMPQSQDHKRIYDNDNGPNTGGMGAYAPANVLDQFELEEVRQHMLKVVKALNYVGVLYAGLMKTPNNEIYFLEFNCRFGDPEAQVLLELLDTDLYTIMNDCVNGNDMNIKWKSGYCGNVVLSHALYPHNQSHELLSIQNIHKCDKGIKLYWGNVMEYDKELYTTGKRVGSMVYYSEHSLRDSFEKIYNNIHKITYPDMYYRRDIGIKELTRFSNNSKHINIGILGSTKGTSMQLLLDSIDKLNATISVVISNKKNAYILERAKKHDISSIYLPFKSSMSKNDYDRQIVNLLRLYKVDVVYLIGYGRIVSNVLINEFPNHIFNIHPSLLPIGKGMWNDDVHKYILENNHKFTGCTLHYVTKNIDSGNIFLQRQLAINKTIKDAETLKKLVQELEAMVIVDSVKILCNEGLNYKNSGVDIDEGNSLVKSIKNISEYMNNKIGGFCAFYEHNGKILGASTDGVGTKLDLAIKMNVFDTIGIDLVAMSVNDLMVCGVRPLFFLDYIAIDKINVNKCKDIIKGIYTGCQMANCQLIGGETAEMKGIYWKDKFDLAGFAVGEVVSQLPREINEGDYIYGIKSSGIHSNGYTLVNKLLERCNYEVDLEPFLTPTKIYYELIPLLQHYGDKLRGMAHITGGGIIDNLPRILPDGLTFEIKLWEFPEIFQWIQNQSGMTQLEMLRTFNCGYGIILVFNEKIQNAEKDNLEYLGRIIKSNQFKILS